jgi:predicted ATP-binding protein involved in virulence
MHQRGSCLAYETGIRKQGKHQAFRDRQSPEAVLSELQVSETGANSLSKTSLSSKGDGVQSLAALSLMRHASQRSASDRQLILAVEEPESHLHPNAIHALRSVLLDIAKQHQVIITTHCPLFIDRHDVNANILVSSNQASCATSVREIRQTMGVRVSDNLSAAEILLLVEGENDRRAMRALLAHFSKRLATAMHSGILGIDTLLGGSNLGYKLAQAREAMRRVSTCLRHLEA